MFLNSYKIIPISVLNNKIRQGRCFRTFDGVRFRAKEKTKFRMQAI